MKDPIFNKTLQFVNRIGTEEALQTFAISIFQELHPDDLETVINALIDYLPTRQAEFAAEKKVEVGG
jgi:hypothetical protein